MRELLIIRNLIDATRLDAMRRAALGSPYVGDSPLRGTFRASRGFAVTFRRTQRGTVCTRFPFLSDFLQLATDPASSRGLWRFGERWLHRGPPNAFYANLLVVPPGAGVGPHVDATLRTPATDPEALPRLVSVLYLQRGNTPGGLLRLRRGPHPIAEIEPSPGTLVHFRGDLTHEVTPVADSSRDAPDPEELRVSLVLEQYRFAPSSLEGVPPLSINTHAPFSAFLDAARERPTPELIVD